MSRSPLAPIVTRPALAPDFDDFEGDPAVDFEDIDPACWADDPPRAALVDSAPSPAQDVRPPPTAATTAIARTRLPRTSPMLGARAGHLWEVALVVSATRAGLLRAEARPRTPTTASRARTRSRR
ncbi:hypothetical protein BN11_1580009 [Nostocoides australiense Ben110]|uniref:Uncharacterized protein n=1 Tax=Nostocoides australiense Ben110 TaxID=1193182 RepID=W6JUT8_9MICO|nr:hypothetical protein BN11_1580009 [Tetrasphaera australiensis Ben110]